ILDVIFESRRVKLIHPPLRGDPLSTLVGGKVPMKPSPALEICRKLLSTLEELDKQPLPLSSTCDPRNVYLVDGEPYFLFLWIKGYTEPPEEKWRELLFFLLTGEFPEKGKAPEQAAVHDRIPEPFRPLVADFLDPRYSRRDVLNRVKAELLRMKREPSPSSKRPLLRPLMRRKKGMLAAAISLALLAGGTYGIWTFSRDLQAEVRTAPVDETQRAGIVFDDGRQEYVWPETIRGGSIIRGSFVPRSTDPLESAHSPGTTATESSRRLCRRTRSPQTEGALFPLPPENGSGNSFPPECSPRQPSGGCHSFSRWSSGSVYREYR